MCEFISWIETKNGPFFLTDKEVFSSLSGERLVECADNDFLGHGAIRAFYGSGAISGIDREIRDFWNPKKQACMPKEISEKLKTPKLFEKHWGMMFEKFFQNDDLCYIVRLAPEPYNMKAAEQLLKRKSRNDDLRYIIRCVPEPYKVNAWKQLLEQKPINNDLWFIFEYAPEPYKTKARKILNSRRK